MITHGNIQLAKARKVPLPISEFPVSSDDEDPFKMSTKLVEPRKSIRTFSGHSAD